MTILETSDLAELLVVEDNANDLELTLRALKKSTISHQIHVVRDGAEALDFLFGKGPYVKRLNSPAPKAIFLDLKLPKIDGIEVLRQIRQHPRTQSIPVVMLTSSQQECDITESYRLGVNSYVVKPIDFSKFVESIAHLSFYWLGLNHCPR